MATACRQKGQSSGGVLRERAVSPSPTAILGDLGECCKLSHRGPGQNPCCPKFFLYFKCRWLPLLHYEIICAHSTRKTRIPR